MSDLQRVPTIAPSMDATVPNLLSSQLVKLPLTSGPDDSMVLGYSRGSTADGDYIGLSAFSLEFSVSVCFKHFSVSLSKSSLFCILSCNMLELFQGGNCSGKCPAEKMAWRPCFDHSIAAVLALPTGVRNARYVATMRGSPPQTSWENAY